MYTASEELTHVKGAVNRERAVDEIGVISRDQVGVVLLIQ